MKKYIDYLDITVVGFLADRGKRVVGSHLEEFLPAVHRCSPADLVFTPGLRVATKAAQSHYGAVVAPCSRTKTACNFASDSPAFAQECVLAILGAALSRTAVWIE